jgi:uncharacterized Ntn-hydrolase superfamily protein
MTFSIIVRDPKTGAFGAAVATGTPAVGGLVLHLAPDIGAIATQGFSTNPFYGTRGLRLMESHFSAEETRRRLIEDDDGRDARQLVIVDRDGCTSGWTGLANVKTTQLILDQDVALAANWVASDAVIVATKEAFESSASSTLAGKLLDALAAGERAGGDSRGLVSAAIRVVCRTHPPIDLRADFDQQPISKLTEIYRATLEPDFQTFLARVPTITDPMRR